jgi:uncharacterized protein YbjT (DUF2867 family)
MSDKNELKKVLVFGATGAQGAPVARQLIEKGIAVRAVSRDMEKVRAFYGDAVEAANAELSDLDSLRKAFEGVDAAFLHLPFVGNVVREMPNQLGNALRAAKETDLPRLVFTTSGSTMDNLPPVAMVEANRAAQRAVLSSGVRSVVLRPTIYLENLLHFSLGEMKENGILSYPPLSPERKISWTAQDDQATLAIAAMTADTVVGKSFDIASPEPVTGVELVEMISRQMGREVRYAPLSPAQFGENMSRIAGSEAGKAVSEMYEATDRLSANGAIVNLESLLDALPVKLTPVSEWIEKQKWN